MKFQIAFLSLLTTAAYAQHEPKGLRGSGSVEDFDFLENNVVNVPQGSTATITGCASGEQCCPQDESYCGSINISGGLILGGKNSGCPNGALPLSGGSTVSGGSNCNLSCSGSCNVSVAAGGGSSAGGSSGGSGGSNSGYPFNGGGSGGTSGYPFNVGGGASACTSIPFFACDKNPFCERGGSLNLSCVPKGSSGGRSEGSSSSYNCWYGCCNMSTDNCEFNPWCAVKTTSYGSTCVHPSNKRPPYEELDEEVDYDPSFDAGEEEEEMTSEDYELDAYDMDMAEE